MTQAKNFSFKESLKIGWKITKENFIFFLLSMIIIFFLTSLNGLITSDTAKAYPYLSGVKFILYAASIFFSLLLNLGIIKVILAMFDGKKPEFKELFSCSDKVIDMFLSSLLYMLIVLGGFILLIVPGIIWGLKYSLYKYFIVEKNANPIEALKLSAQATSGAKWNLLLFGFLCAGVNVLGALCLGVGLFFTIPLTWVAMAFIYRQLLGQINNTSPKSTKAKPAAQR